MDHHALVASYFARALDPDRESYVALFSPDVVVEDDGRTWRGLDDVRRWRAYVPDVTYTVRSVAGSEDRALAVAEVAGNFPGSPVELRFSFEYDAAGLVRGLRIEA
ncbi:nuclear transport factor 2 family protein [Nocardioides sp. W7]|uniref:nuclear transport factor 2 family protein n=1 Tax=Nocardioides sp. W7 TaxID=2931390 RepID=UPI001FD03557|nr:nuclear transport factor 2 family protein [Nocardioides sp. W7]